MLRGALLAATTYVSLLPGVRDKSPSFVSHSAIAVSQSEESDGKSLNGGPGRLGVAWRGVANGKRHCMVPVKMIRRADLEVA